MHHTIWNKQTGEELGWVDGDKVFRREADRERRQIAIVRDGQLYDLAGKPTNIRLAALLYSSSGTSHMEIVKAFKRL